VEAFETVPSLLQVGVVLPKEEEKVGALPHQLLVDRDGAVHRVPAVRRRSVGPDVVFDSSVGPHRRKGDRFHDFHFVDVRESGDVAGGSEDLDSGDIAFPDFVLFGPQGVVEIDCRPVSGGVEQDVVRVVEVRDVSSDCVQIGSVCSFTVVNEEIDIEFPDFFPRRNDHLLPVSVPFHLGSESSPTSLPLTVAVQLFTTSVTMVSPFVPVMVRVFASQSTSAPRL